jgi:hypothetical protein
MSRIKVIGNYKIRVIIVQYFNLFNHLLSLCHIVHKSNFGGCYSGFIFGFYISYRYILKVRVTNFHSYISIFS